MNASKDAFICFHRSRLAQQFAPFDSNSGRTVAFRCLARLAVSGALPMPSKETKAIAVLLAALAMSPRQQAIAESNPVFQFQFLFQECKTPTEFCAGYVTGVGEMMWLTGASQSSDKTYAICPGRKLPSGAAMVQAVLNFGQAHPEMWSEEMVAPTILALQEVWPCK